MSDTPLSYKMSTVVLETDDKGERTLRGHGHNELMGSFQPIKTFTPEAMLDGTYVLKLAPLEPRYVNQRLVEALGLPGPWRWLNAGEQLCDGDVTYHGHAPVNTKNLIESVSVGFMKRRPRVADNCELLYMRSVPVPEEEEAEEEGESPAVYISRNETMQSIMRAAAELHGALEEGVFNAACFAHAWSDWMGGETLDGATVRAILSKRDDVSELPNHRDHYLILRTANRPG